MRNIISKIKNVLNDEYLNSLTFKEKKLRSTAKFYNIEVKLIPSDFQGKSTKAILCRVYEDKLEFPNISVEYLELPDDKELFNSVYLSLFKMFNFPSFGCCSLFTECSNQKKCIHPDIVYAQACVYRKNLENGRIFY